MKIHCTAMVLVIAAGIILKLSVTEWCICLVLFGMILALELVNTAIEAVVDLVTEEYRPLAKLAKDTAAGAVLIASIMAAGAGILNKQTGFINRRQKGEMQHGETGRWRKEGTAGWHWRSGRDSREVKGTTG